MWGIKKVSQIVIESATLSSRVCVVAGAASSRGRLPERCWGGTARAISPWVCP